MIIRSRLAAAALAAAASLGLACAYTITPPQHPPPPPPCVGNDTVYGPADSARGVVAAAPTTLVLPPPEMRGGVDAVMTVDSRGRVEPRSIELSAGLTPHVAALLRERVAMYEFRPAVFHGCAVRFRFAIQIEH